MWRYFALFFCFANALEEYSPNYFCAEMGPQHIINVPQLMGIWNAVEKIDHQDERHYVRKLTSCPAVHISEDYPPTTMNPLYRNNQQRGYGEGYGYTGGVSQQYQYGRTQDDFNRDRQGRVEYDYDRRTTTDRNYLPRRPYQNPSLQKRYLRMFWDEIGGSTEYHVWYNISAPGFWISSGPENGVSLKSQFSHYAGNIQVLKVVGDHMVLTVCHQLPERQLYTILLSRETTLSPFEIHGVHRMLNRKGLHTNAVEKLCYNGASRFHLSAGLSLFVMVFFIYSILK